MIGSKLFLWGMLAGALGLLLLGGLVVVLVRRLRRSRTPVLRPSFVPTNYNFNEALGRLAKEQAAYSKMTPSEKAKAVEAKLERFK